MNQEKFSGLYRIASARAQWWDYSNNGSYFITICTSHFRRILGEISEQKIILSQTGEVVRQEWIQSFIIRNEIQCDAFTIMPNHLHAIITLRRKCNDPGTIKKTATGVAYRAPKSISTFVGGFKAAVTSRLRQMHLCTNSIWHPRFHDHIIRNEKEYDRIKKYIIENPARWEKDHCRRRTSL